MSVNTQALIRSTPKAAPSADGQASDGGQNGPKDAAEQFQSMLSTVRGKEADPQNNKGPKHADQTSMAEGETSPENGQAERSGQQSIGEGAETRGKASFPVSNLADAIRTVSQTVMGKADGDQTGTGQSGAASNAHERRTQAGLPGALPLGTVLAARMPQAQTAPQADSNPGAAKPQPVPAALMNSAQGAVIDGEGAGKTGTSSLFAQFGIEPERVGEGGTGQAGARTALPEEAAGTVKVLRQETHFAPNQRLSPAQQVGDQIATALKDLPNDMGRVQGGLTAKAEGPVLKTLDIQLTPHELGTVKVSLRMVGDAVEVTLATSKAQTAELLKQDRQLLDQMLRTTGFKADTITIQAADDRGNATSSNLSNNSSAQGQQGTGTGGFGDNQNASGNGPGTRGGQTGSKEEPGPYPGYETVMEDGHENGTDSRLSDGIYM